MNWHGSAEFVDHPLLGRLRMRLDRWRGPGPRALVCMCNPSSAGADKDDPTIRRCKELLADYDGFTVVNWEPFVASAPVQVHIWRAAAARDHADAYSKACDDNDALISGLAAVAPVVIVGWGALVPNFPRTTAVLRALSVGGGRPLMAFGLTKDGLPKHPMARGKHRLLRGEQLVTWRAVKEQPL